MHQVSNLLLMATGSLAQGSAPDIPWIRMTFVLILCIGLAFAAVGFLRIRYGMPFLPERFVNPIKASIEPGEKPERLAIVERLAAGPSSQFVILARGKHRYLIHMSQSGTTVIDQFTENASEEANQ